MEAEQSTATTTPPWNEVEPELWDAYDHVCVLGIESHQKRELLEQAPTTPRGEAIRNDVLFPYVKNRRPQLHQIVFVTKYFSVLFAESGKTQLSESRSSSSFAEADPSKAIGKRRPFLLCDDAGMGKTTIALMVMAYRRWIIQAEREDVLIPLNSRAVLSALLNLDTSSFSIEYNKKQLVERKPVLVVTPNATKEQFCNELDAVLDHDHFLPRPFYEFSKPFGRKSFVRQVAELRSGKTDVCPVVIMSWHDLLSEDTRQQRLGTESDGDDDKSEENCLHTAEWGFLVLDEVQEARQPDTARFQDVRRFPPRADHTLAMTATPLWNAPVDLVNMLRASGMDTGKPFPGWKDVPRPPREISRVIESRYEDCHRSFRIFAQFCQTLDWERQAIQRALKALPSTHSETSGRSLEDWDILFPDECPEEAKPLKKKWDELVQWYTWATIIALDMARGYVVRRRRVDHLGLLPHEATQRSVELSRELRIAYDKICLDQEAARWAEEDDDWLPSQAGEEINLGSTLPAGFDIRKRIVLVDPARISDSYKEIPSPKVELAIQLCKDIIQKEKDLSDKRKQKIAIYCEWSDPDVVKHITRRFEEAGIPLAVLNGKMNDDSKGRVISDFQKDKDHKSTCKTKTRILLFSQCISAGVNLHRASVLITLDNVWTFAKREQIEGRILRMGQDRLVTIYRLVCPNTIDEGMLFAQMRKSRMVDRMEREWCERTTPFGPQPVGSPETPKCNPPRAGPPPMKKRKGSDSLPNPRPRKARKVRGG